MNIKNKTVIVTGGASGLGLATCRYLADLGAKIAIFDLNEVAGQALVDELNGAAIFAKVNVTDEASVAAGIAKAVSAFGAIHVCINCAGIVAGGKTVGREGALAFGQVFTSHQYQLDRHF